MTTNEQGFVLQLGETLQTAIVGVLDGSSTIFRSIIGTLKDSTVFTIRSSKEVSDELGGALSSTLKNTIEETRSITAEGTKVTFSFVNEVGKNLKDTTLGALEGGHEVSVKAANTTGKTIVDLTQCGYDVSAKVGNIAKTAAINSIRGAAEVGEELFGKIKTGVGGVINFDNIRFGKKKTTASTTIDQQLENN